MKLAPPRQWATGLVAATALVLGTAQITSAAVDAPRQVTAPAAATTTLTEYPRVGQPNLYTQDVNRLSGFYQQLGFTEIFRFPLPDGTVAFASLQRGPFYLTMANTSVIKDATGLWLLGPSFRKQSDITVIVADVDATVAQLRAQGAGILMDPRDQPWGERQAYVADPDGGLVQISTHNG